MHCRLSFGNANFFSNYTVGPTGILHLEADRLNPGYVIFTDYGGLTSTNGHQIINVAGKIGTLGFEDGPVATALFEGLVWSFVHINNTHLIVADTQNNCLRLVNRADNVVTTYAGKCKHRGNKAGNLSEARLKEPRYLTWGLGAYSDRLYVEDFHAVRYIYNDFVWTFLKDKNTFLDINGMAFDTASENKMLFTTTNFIKSMVVVPYGRPLVTVFEAKESLKVYSMSNRVDRDGPFSDGLVPGKSNMIALAKNVYVKTGLAGTLRVIDLKKKGFSSICKNYDNGFSFHPGSISACQLPYVTGVGMAGNILYAGGKYGIYGIQGKRARERELLHLFKISALNSNVLVL